MSPSESELSEQRGRERERRRGEERERVLFRGGTDILQPGTTASVWAARSGSSVVCPPLNDTTIITTLEEQIKATSIGTTLSLPPREQGEHSGGAREGGTDRRWHGGELLSSHRPFAQTGGSAPYGSLLLTTTAGVLQEGFDSSRDMVHIWRKATGFKKHY
ncbi:Hypothetical predicted protein [Xyrichtys novacula]|uniref:Uncharacterized protein n=1 Tax=Xyrichtys novacula TaxID=13765 RepID=A0AAV1EJY3_XYRNO|nr:Hypothetical predicted protein [Xyrichtys novacula]